MQAFQSNLQSDRSRRLLRFVSVIMNFTYRYYKDLQRGALLVPYTEREFPLPKTLRDFIKNNVIALKDSYLTQAYLSLLTKPDRIDGLIDSFMNAFINKGHLYTDLNFMEWTIMCSLISAVLYDRGFKEAPDIAVETVRGICCIHNRYNAFKNFGCNI